MIRLSHRVSHAATMVDTGPRTYSGQAKGPRGPDALYRWRAADAQLHVQSQPPPR